MQTLPALNIHRQLLLLFDLPLAFHLGGSKEYYFL
jgi:hypothetical protein